MGDTSAKRATVSLCAPAVQAVWICKLIGRVVETTDCMNVRDKPISSRCAPREGRVHLFTGVDPDTPKTSKPLPNFTPPAPTGKSWTRE
jgi:hypothetical protein